MAQPESRETEIARIDAIKARVEKATDGPWAENYAHPDVWVEGDSEVELVVIPERTDIEAEDERWEQRKRDTEFIAHARVDVPWLLRQIEVYRSLAVGVIDGIISPMEARYALQDPEAAERAVETVARKEPRKSPRDKGPLASE